MNNRRISVLAAGVLAAGSQEVRLQWFRCLGHTDFTLDGGCITERFVKSEGHKTIGFKRLQNMHL